jgi:uncharacterized RDD family membrane protein YckC
MKCPKCGYLGFEDSERCRNCGYEFSLARLSPSVPDVLIHPDAPVPGPNPDFFLGNANAAPDDAAPARDPSLDLDRLGEMPGPAARELPLFGGRPDDDSRRITTPSRPRAPLAVRRATPEVPRARTRTPRPQTGVLDLGASPAAALGFAESASIEGGEAQAALWSRTMAAMVDLGIVCGVDAAVVYFTLRLCGLQVSEWAQLPVVPLIAFLTLLNGGYFVAFTAVGGQSIGKMAVGVRVVSQESQPVTFGRATLRVLVCLASALPLGLGFLPALVGRDRRALHDRVSHTRVIRSSSP